MDILCHIQKEKIYHYFNMKKQTTYYETASLDSRPANRADADIKEEDYILYERLYNFCISNGIETPDVCSMDNAPFSVKKKLISDRIEKFIDKNLPK